MSMPQRPMVRTSSGLWLSDLLPGVAVPAASVVSLVAVVAVVTVIASPHPWGPQASRDGVCAGRHCEACLTVRLQVKHLSEHLTSDDSEANRTPQTARSPHRQARRRRPQPPSWP